MDVHPQENISIKQEPNNLEDIMCHFIIDYYAACLNTIKHIFLVEFVANQKKDGTPVLKRKKPNVIIFVNYRKHVDYENYCKENLLLYVPFENNELSLNQCHSTWQVVYNFNGETIQMIQSKFTFL